MGANSRMKSLRLLSCFASLPLFGTETLRPLENHAAWKFTDPAAWVWGTEGGATVLSLKTPSSYKPPFRSPFHICAIPNMGLTLGEIFFLEELAEDCAADGRYAFLLVAPPLPVTNGVGTPINPYAMK